MDAWEGKGAVVTGANSPIGIEITKLLVSSGLNVVGMDKETDVLEKLKMDNDNLHVFKVDLNNEQEILEAFQWVEKEINGADVLINSASVCKPVSILGQASISCVNYLDWKIMKLNGTVEEKFRIEHIFSPSLHNQTLDCDINECREMLKINVLGLSLCSREAFRSMSDRRIQMGHIIHIGSIVGHNQPSNSNMHMYSVTKHAVSAINECMRQELESFDSPVKTTLISPSLFEKSAKKFGIDAVIESDDIVQAIVYILTTPIHVQVGDITLKKDWSY